MTSGVPVTPDLPPVRCANCDRCAGCHQPSCSFAALTYCITGSCEMTYWDRPLLLACCRERVTPKPPSHQARVVLSHAAAILSAVFFTGLALDPPGGFTPVGRAAVIVLAVADFAASVVGPRNG